MTQINAWAALGPKEKLVPHKFDPGQLKAMRSRSKSSTAASAIPTYPS